MYTDKGKCTQTRGHVYRQGDMYTDKSTSDRQEDIFKDKETFI